MEAKEIKDKEIWENFLLKSKEKTFLSSWNWGEFNQMMKNEIWRMGIFEKNQLLAIALLIKTLAKRGKFLFLPHGPVLSSQFKPSRKSEILKTLLWELKKIAKRERLSFIRISPIWERNEENIKIFQHLGFREAPIHIHPEVTWQLDITPAQEQLLMGLRKTTRYLIRQAQRNKEIEIFQSQNLKDLEIFHKLYQEVALFQGFSPFSFDYLKNEFLAFQPEGEISLFFGKYQGEIVSSGIFIFWSDIAFYHHGAFSRKYPKIPVSYLLLWEAILEAKKRGCQTFNFWGISPKENSHHPWAGLSLFKMGFGGEAKEYLKTQDFPLSKKYWLTFLFEKLRKAKRGF